MQYLYGHLNNCLYTWQIKHTNMSSVVITGTGHVLPEKIVTNEEFVEKLFLDENGQPFEKAASELIEKFVAITGIENRRYAKDDQNNSDLGIEAAQKAIAESGVDPEEIGVVIAAHNFGDVEKQTGRTDVLPSIAARIKHGLNIANPSCVAFDILFGCPGWVQGMILGEMYISSGKAKHVLVVGCETLSRVLDPSDRDSMIFADGSGAAVLSKSDADDGYGIIHSKVNSHTQDEAFFLHEGPSYKPGSDPNERYIKMKGRKIYEYALKNVPAAIKSTLDEAGVHLSEVKKIFLHQANSKLDHAVVSRLFKLFDMNGDVDKIMPMSIRNFGNSSVATVPTLFDLVRKTRFEGHRLHDGDTIVFASVGAGMNINAMVYKYKE